jgi:hypothetical protein
VGGKITKFEQLYNESKTFINYDLDANNVIKAYNNLKDFETCGDNDLIIKIASLFYNIFRQNPEQKEIFERLIEIVIPIHEFQKDYSKLGSML